MGSDTDKPDRRQGKLSSTGDILSGKQGRKVFTGVWVMIMTNIWFGFFVVVGHGLSEKAYIWLITLAVLLIGFGTVLDTFVAELGHKLVDVIGQWVGSKVSILANKVDKVEVKTDVQQPAA